METITIPMAKALSLFHEKCPKIDLDGTVEFKGVKFRYATLSNITDKIKGALKDAGLIYFHSIDAGKNTVKCTLVCIEDGSTITSEIPSEFTGMPQNVGAKITYFKRYTLQSVLGIVAEEDNDATGSVEIEKMTLDEKLMNSAILKIRQKVEPFGELMVKILSKFNLTAEQIERLYAVKFEDEIQAQ